MSVSALTSINSKLNVARQVCERIHESFPYMSPTRIFYENPKQVVQDKDLLMKLRIKQAYIMDARSKRDKYIDNPVEFYKKVIEDTRRIYALNCGEYSYLSYLGLRINGFKDCEFVKPKTVQNKRVIDHVLVKVNEKSPESSIFVDAWLNITETANNMKEICAKKFGRFFDLVPDENIDFVQKEYLIELNDNDVLKLKKLVPELDLNV